MDWFQRITGFEERDYHTTRERLAVEDGQLVSRVDGSRHGVGRFELVTLRELRERARMVSAGGRRTTVRCLAGEVRALHSDPAFEGAWFQVASQFNALEMASPDVTPEDGVTRYIHDRTQGPACAIAAGAATIWRNYFAPVGDGHGQTANRQIDALEGLGGVLASRLGTPVQALWAMRNGYALCTPDGLAAIGRLLSGVMDEGRDALRGELAIALHRDVEVTDQPMGSRRLVSQAFCSALPVAYSRIPLAVWEPFARLVLEATYEATLRVAVEDDSRGRNRTVLLTRLGGGAFGNDDRWIDDAIERALQVVTHAGLDVVLLSHGSVHPCMRRIAEQWSQRREAD